MKELCSSNAFRDRGATVRWGGGGGRGGGTVSDPILGEGGHKIVFLLALLNSKNLGGNVLHPHPPAP